MPSPKKDFTPRYHVIEQALRSRLAQARPHDPVPSENQLSTEFGVCRMTARAAVQRLVTDGLLYRESGRGTFVAPPHTPRRADNLVRFSEEMRRQGRTPTSRPLEAGLRPASDTEAGRLRLRPGSRVVAIRRVRLADGVPVALEHAVFPPELAPLLDYDLTDGSLHEALTTLGRVPAAGHASVSAVAAGAAEAGALRVDSGTPLLVETRLILDRRGVPLELTESRYVGDRYALDVAFVVEHPAE